MAKKELTISEFREIIKEEALKLKKRMVLENEKKALEAELNTINEAYMEEMEMEEGRVGDWLGTSSKAKMEALKKDFILKANLWSKQGKIASFDEAQLNALMMKAAEDNYEGKVGYDPETQSMSYRDGDDINWAGLGLARGGSFGGTGAER